MKLTKHIILIAISILLLASPVAAKKHKNNPLLKQKFTSVEQVINELERCEYFSLFGVEGVWGYVSSNYILAGHLDKMATTEQLDSLSLYGKTPVVKTTAFVVLVNGRHSISSEQVLSILLKHLPDTTGFEYVIFDLMGRDNISSFITERAYSSGILSPVDSAYADSLIFYTDEYAHNPRFYTIMKNNIGNPEIYPRIRDLYVRIGDNDLLPFIACYQKNEDIPLMIEALGGFQG